MRYKHDKNESVNTQADKEIKCLGSEGTFQMNRAWWWKMMYFNNLTLIGLPLSEGACESG